MDKIGGHVDATRPNPDSIDLRTLPSEAGVYLLRSGAYVKIGRSSNLAARIRSLLGSSPTMDLIGFFRHERSVELERFLHFRMRPYLHRGEWFELDDDQVLEIGHLVATATRKQLDVYMADPIDLGGGKWKVRVYLGLDQAGKQIRRSKTFKADGIRRARTVARQIEDEMQTKRAEAAKDPTPTVAEATEAWWELWCRRQRSPTTRKGYRSIIDRHILAAPFAATKVTVVTVAELDDWYGRLPVSPSTVRRVDAVLSQVFKQEVRAGHLTANPAQLAYKPEARPKVKSHTTVETVLSLLEAAHRRSPVRSRLLAFAALTGLRRGELCGLRWSAVDLEAGILIVELNVVKAQQRFISPGSSSREPVLHVKDPKSHQVAGIALDRQAVNIAGQQAAWQQTLAVAEDPYLWSVQPPFAVPLHPDTATNWFTQAAKDAGVVGVSLHDLRHWQGSQLLEVGATVQDVKERLRHKSLQTTMGYLHADHSRQRVLVDLLPQLELPGEVN